MDATSPRSDSELVDEALAGSQAAYRSLVLRFERPIFSLIVRMVRHSQLAEDLTQDVFVKAFRALASYDHQRKLSSWLFKIAHNATIDHLRKGRLSTVPLDPARGESPALVATIADEGVESPEEASERKELAELLEAAIDELRSTYREVLLLRHREELSYQEIADITGSSLGAVKTNIHRGRKELAEILRGQGLADDPVYDD